MALEIERVVAVLLVVLQYSKLVSRIATRHIS